MPFDQPVEIVQGPPEIADWPETARITSVEFQPGNFIVRHSKEGTGPGAWPGVHVPGWGNLDQGGSDPGNIQWTLWIVLNADGRWVTSGCIEFWPGKATGVGGPFSDGARNWWYQASGLAGRQPGPGARIGVFAVAGDQRMKDVRSVQERSNIGWVTVPANDTGVITFATADPPTPAIPDPVLPIPAPPPVDVAVLQQMFKALADIQHDVLTRASKDDLNALRQEVLTAGKTLGALLAPIADTPASPQTAVSILSRFFKR